MPRWRRPGPNTSKSRLFNAEDWRFAEIAAEDLGNAVVFESVDELEECSGRVGGDYRVQFVIQRALQERLVPHGVVRGIGRVPRCCLRQRRSGQVSLARFERRIDDADQLMSAISFHKLTNQ